MGRARALQEIRMMRFEALLDRHERGALSQSEAARGGRGDPADAPALTRGICRLHGEALSRAVGQAAQGSARLGGSAGRICFLSPGGPYQRMHRAAHRS